MRCQTFPFESRYHRRSFGARLSKRRWTYWSEWLCSAGETNPASWIVYAPIARRAYRRHCGYCRSTSSRQKEQFEQVQPHRTLEGIAKGDYRSVSSAKSIRVAAQLTIWSSFTDFAMSPDDQYCAVTSEDGCLRIIECSSQRLLDTFQGYFGALTCVNWSPDGRFVLTGGQDDLACVWSPFEQRIVARCEGHSSFLTGLSFDPWRCDSRTQRFASVSEDCKLILWDLSSAALQRPKGHHQHGHQVSTFRVCKVSMGGLG